jgi:GH15 family glucan-1,4-alpha-glucosidase
MPGLIEDYGLIGDLQTAALVGRDGSIDWLCQPRFDSPACFAALLDDERAGHWLLAPAGGGPCTRRRYRGESLVLETEWETPDGTVRVVDAMPLRGEATDFVRVVEGQSGGSRWRWSSCCALTTARCRRGSGRLTASGRRSRDPMRPGCTARSPSSTGTAGRAPVSR